jgi:hypothetical protein
VLLPPTDYPVPGAPLPCTVCGHASEAPKRTRILVIVRFGTELLHMLAWRQVHLRALEVMVASNPYLRAFTSEDSQTITTGYIMLTLITTGITLSMVSWVLWRFLRRFVVKTDLDNVPGPASHSLFKGMSRDIYLPSELSFYKGNFTKLFNANAWAYHTELAQQCKAVISTMQCGTLIPMFDQMARLLESTRYLVYVRRIPSRVIADYFVGQAIACTRPKGPASCYR